MDHQNAFDQLLVSLARDLDQINAVELENAVNSQCPLHHLHLYEQCLLDHVLLAGVSVSSLGSAGLQTYTSLNVSALDQFEKQVNVYAGVRDHLMSFTADLVVGTSNTIKLQAAALSHITQATHQLTRASVVSLSLSLSPTSPISFCTSRCWQRTNVIN